MSDKVFIDTNVIIYSYSSSEVEKRQIAHALIREQDSYISTQVLTELCNIITKKLKFTYKVAEKAVQECCNNNKLFINN
ncbi:PIN domain-containing protein [Sphingobacterium wenxiniae]|uniref:PIN domain-containing protein n=1 Tax=Sphingobacterium wenxiniae TaxID=683125 RepID=A0A1I6UBL0_9SPHI|nr:PIN domain-containing protein [Sphingobacterium wenxiniae]